jgi:hypothetical protein
MFMANYHRIIADDSMNKRIKSTDDMLMHIKKVDMLIEKNIMVKKVGGLKIA